MQLPNVDPVFPGLRSVAALAIDAKFTLVHIGVAIGAGSTDFGKFRAFVATHALGNFVCANQRKTGCFVAENHRVFHFRPRFGSVAIHTFPFYFAVRILHIALRILHVFLPKNHLRQPQNHSDDVNPFVHSALLFYVLFCLFTVVY